MDRVVVALGGNALLRQGAEDTFEEGDLWSDVLDRKGGGYTLLARMPEDPSLN